jgi:hypothetical protein
MAIKEEGLSRFVVELKNQKLCGEKGHPHEQRVVISYQGRGCKVLVHFTGCESLYTREPLYNEIMEYKRILGSKITI